MLVLQRDVGESFRIGDDVEVRILHVAGKGAKVGVIAPREVRIVRTELARMNQEASRGWRAGDLRDLATRLRGGG